MIVNNDTCSPIFNNPLAFLLAIFQIQNKYKRKKGIEKGITVSQRFTNHEATIENGDLRYIDNVEGKRLTLR